MTLPKMQTYSAWLPLVEAKRESCLVWKQPRRWYSSCPISPKTALGLSPGVPARGFTRVFLGLALIFAGARLCSGYSLLTHEEIVDILWNDRIQPLLLKRFPEANAEQLRLAHAHAYGGCLIQDMGYYPFGSKFFSDLTHYVRTGDFVTSLIQESTNIDEYAFALGALEHYTADNNGHPFVNRAVALTYPKLRARYGDQVTYEQSPKSHIKVEFGFDVTQVSKNRYTSDKYHDFIGFEVAKPALERAFAKTYGLPVEAVMGHIDLAVGTFRYAASDTIPDLTRAAVRIYHPQTLQETPDAIAKRFLFNLSHAQYETRWGNNFRKPGLLTRLFDWVPRIPWVKSMIFVVPTAETEELYFQSINQTVSSFRRSLRQVDQGDTRFPNLDCDTGRDASAGEYGLMDDAYARLLDELFKRGFDQLQPDLRTNLLSFFATYPPPKNTRKAQKAWQRTMDEVQALKAGRDSPVTAEIRQRLLAPPRRLESPKAKGA